MDQTELYQRQINNELRIKAARIVECDERSVFAYADSDNFIIELLKHFTKVGRQIITVGNFGYNFMPMIDYISMPYENIGAGIEFEIDVDRIIDRISKSDSIACLSNPDRLSGANLSLSDLERITSAVSEGMLVIDEYYFNFFGISGLSLLNEYDNIIVIRSFAGGDRRFESNSGFAIADPSMVNRINEINSFRKFSWLHEKIIKVSLKRRSYDSGYIKNTNDQTLQLAVSLNKLSVRSYLVPADFILIKTIDVDSVSAFLVKSKIPHRRIGSYIRFRIEDEQTAENLVDTFEAMPYENYRTQKVENRKLILRRPPENGENVLVKKSQQQQLEPASS